jgi:hypothetical protein
MGNIVTIEKVKPPQPIRDGVSEPLKLKAERVSSCLLEQYYATAVGVGVGLAMSIQRKNVRPFIMGVMFGTIGDFLNGYYGPCRELREDLEAAKLAELSASSSTKH